MNSESLREVVRANLGQDLLSLCVSTCWFNQISPNVKGYEPSAGLTGSPGIEGRIDVIALWDRPLFG